MESVKVGQYILAFFRLIRWPNLLLMSGALLLIRYTFFIPLSIPFVLDELRFALLVFSTACIGASGYVVNDIYDLENDRVNKPDRMQIGRFFSERFAWNSFYALFLVGAALGWYLGQYTGRSLYGAINIITGFWLYLYAADFKGRPLLGNVMISFLSAGVLTYPLFFDVLPRLPLTENDPGLQALLILSVYFCYAFTISLMRELVKDMEDIEGDQKIGLRTLPIAWGKGIARALILFIGLLLFSSFGYIGFLSWSGNIISGSYILFALSLPTFMALVLSIRAKKPSDFHFVSSLLKGVMAAAILSIPVITLSSI